MNRARTAKGVEEQVLLLCRRRCAICFGLRRDTTIKRGQIAHLDQDASNSKRSNLVFLCFECHDEYDGRTSQSKGLTHAEVKLFRDELHEAIASEWKAPASFAGAKPPTYSIAGHYVREGPNEEAELDVTILPDGRVRIEGFALWGTSSSTGPHVGNLAFVARVAGNSIVFQESFPEGEYRLELAFGQNGLQATESGRHGSLGMNVSFGGQYYRVGSGTAG